MKESRFMLEISVVAEIIVWLGAWDKESACTPVEIKGPNIHIAFDLKVSCESVVVQRKIKKAVQKLYSEGFLGSADTRLGPLLEEIRL